MAAADQRLHLFAADDPELPAGTVLPVARLPPAPHDALVYVVHDGVEYALFRSPPDLIEFEPLVCSRCGAPLCRIEGSARERCGSCEAGRWGWVVEVAVPLGVCHVPPAIGAPALARCDHQGAGLFKGRVYHRTDAARSEEVQDSAVLEGILRRCFDLSTDSLSLRGSWLKKG